MTVVVTWCRRCREEYTGADWSEWLASHPCVARARPAPAPPPAPEALAHGDARRYDSRTQRCRCPRCTEAYLDSKEKFRSLDFRIAPPRRGR